MVRIHPSQPILDTTPSKKMTSISKSKQGVIHQGKSPDVTASCAVIGLMKPLQTCMNQHVWNYFGVVAE